jgi:hypothetical protein
MEIDYRVCRFSSHLHRLSLEIPRLSLAAFSAASLIRVLRLNSTVGPPSTTTFLPFVVMFFDIQMGTQIRSFVVHSSTRGVFLRVAEINESALGQLINDECLSRVVHTEIGETDISVNDPSLMDRLQRCEKRFLAKADRD